MSRAGCRPFIPEHGRWAEQQPRSGSPISLQELERGKPGIMLLLTMLVSARSADSNIPVGDASPITGGVLEDNEYEYEYDYDYDDDYYLFDDDQVTPTIVADTLAIVTECFVREKGQMAFAEKQAELCVTAGEHCQEQTIFFNALTTYNESAVETDFNLRWWEGWEKWSGMKGAQNEATGTYLDWDFMNETGYRTICAKPNFAERYRENGTFGNHILHLLAILLSCTCT
jgi:hypothetical protein